MSSHYLDFSSCGIVPDFCKSGHICVHIVIYTSVIYDIRNFHIMVALLKGINLIIPLASVLLLMVHNYLCV